MGDNLSVVYGGKKIDYIYIQIIGIVVYGGDALSTRKKTRVVNEFPINMLNGVV